MDWRWSLSLISKTDFQGTSGCDMVVTSTHTHRKGYHSLQYVIVFLRDDGLQKRQNET